MKMRAFSRILLAMAASLLLANCGKNNNPYDSNNNPPVVTGPTYYVSNTGDNTMNTGTSPALPFKTITRGLAAASVAANSAVSVAPGTYNAVNGESFPLFVPNGVSLIGDEIYRGLGTSPTTHTTIAGGAPSPVATIRAAIVPGLGATVAGFEITNVDGTSGAIPSGIVLTSNGVTIRNNTVTASTSTGIYVGASTGHLITGNSITFSPNGLTFGLGGASSRVQGNAIAFNTVGISYFVAGGDLGSVGGSTGGNSIFCNTAADLVIGAGILVFARNNFWDHQSPTAAPTAACTPGTDICGEAGATIDATGAQIALGFCL